MKIDLSGYTKEFVEQLRKDAQEKLTNSYRAVIAAEDALSKAKRIYEDCDAFYNALAHATPLEHVPVFFQWKENEATKSIADILKGPVTALNALTTWKEKILFLTNDPLSFGIPYFTGPALIETLLDNDDSLRTLDRETVKKKVGPVVSHMFRKGELVRYRIKGNKQINVVINRRWTNDDGDLLEEHSELLDKIEKEDKELEVKSPT